MEVPIRVDGRYRVRGCIGSGAYGAQCLIHDMISAYFLPGAVYRATDIYKKRDVALKLEPAEDSSYLENEAEVYESLAGLSGFPKLLWYGSDAGLHALAMDLLGPSLAMLQASLGRFSLKTVGMVAFQTVSGLCYLFSRYSI